MMVGSELDYGFGDPLRLDGLEADRSPLHCKLNAELDLWIVRAVTRIETNAMIWFET
jgi:hypothetical protein